MNFTGPSSIKTKLIVMIAGVSMILMTVVFIIYTIGETRHLRKTLEQKTVLAARTAGEFATTDLTFADREAATNTLRLLQTSPAIIYAALYDKHNNLFASYGDRQRYQLIRQSLKDEELKYTDDSLIVREKIYLDDEVIGSILIETSTLELQQEISDFILLASIIFVIALLLSAILANYFQRFISGPILDLTDKIRQVTQTGNYRIQIQRSSDDEIGVLSENINLLLASLELRKSQRDRAEKALQDERNKLKKNVHERTIELEAAIRELQAFSSSVSHDLRAPLRSIDGFSNILLEDYYQQFDEQGRDYLRRIRSATLRMGDLIDDLLMLSRISRSDLTYEDVDISGLCHTIIDRMQTLATEPRAIRIDIQQDMSLYVDRKLITIALENLISNAWKYTLHKPEPHIRIHLSASDGECTLCIEDNGAGFDMAHANKLFAPLQRLHTAEEFEGTGIGLAIVDRIINKHGASIQAEGYVGKGARFCMSFWDRAYDGEDD